MKTTSWRLPGALAALSIISTLCGTGCGELPTRSEALAPEKNLGSSTLPGKTPCPPGSLLDNAIAEYGEEAAKALAKAKKIAWRLDPKVRGQIIEDALAKTEYSRARGYVQSCCFRADGKIDRYFPLIDFQKGNTVVSLKTVDPSIKTIDRRLKEFERHIEELVTRPLVDGKKTNAVLDIRIPPGADKSVFKPLEEVGEELGVVVEVRTF